MDIPRRKLLAQISATILGSEAVAAAVLSEPPQSSPAVPTPLAYAFVVSPSSPGFAGIAVPPVFAPILFVAVTVQNAAVGVAYTINIAGQAKAGGGFSIPGSFPPPGTPGAWALYQSQLQMGDTLVSAPVVSLYIPAGTVSATLVNN